MAETHGVVVTGHCGAGSGSGIAPTFSDPRSPSELSFDASEGRRSGTCDVRAVVLEWGHRRRSSEIRLAAQATSCIGFRCLLSSEIQGALSRLDQRSHAAKLRALVISYNRMPSSAGDEGDFGESLSQA